MPIKTGNILPLVVGETGGKLLLYGSLEVSFADELWVAISPRGHGITRLGVG